MTATTATTKATCKGGWTHDAARPCRERGWEVRHLDKVMDVLGMLLFAAIALVAIMFCLWIRDSAGAEKYAEGYRQGQIDALTGNVRMVLTTQPDRSQIWVEVK